MSDKIKGNTPEERRAWIEKIAGFSERNVELQKLTEAIGDRRSKSVVLDIAKNTLEQPVVEAGGQYQVGDFTFEFDVSGKLKSIAYSVTDNQVVVQTKGVWI